MKINQSSVTIRFDEWGLPFNFRWVRYCYPGAYGIFFSILFLQVGVEIFMREGE